MSYAFFLILFQDLFHHYKFPKCNILESSPIIYKVKNNSLDLDVEDPIYFHIP